MKYSIRSINSTEKNNNKQEKKKKTEHTNIARSSLKLLRQNIHVMLSYANKRKYICSKNIIVVEKTAINKIDKSGFGGAKIII